MFLITMVSLTYTLPYYAYVYVYRGDLSCQANLCTFQLCIIMDGGGVYDLLFCMDFLFGKSFNYMYVQFMASPRKPNNVTLEQGYAAFDGLANNLLLTFLVQPTCIWCSSYGAFCLTVYLHM